MTLTIPFEPNHLLAYFLWAGAAAMLYQVSKIVKDMSGGPADIVGYFGVLAALAFVAVFTLGGLLLWKA